MMGFHFKLFQVLLFAAILTLGQSSQANPGTERSRPFWTEKTTYTEGDRTYVVGVASHAKSLEDGRNRALQGAREELSESLKLSGVDEITLHSQMAFQENTKEGMTVFRLFWVSAKDIDQLKSNHLKKLEKQARKMESSIQQNRAVIDRLERQAEEEARLRTRAQKLEAKIQETTALGRSELRCGMTIAEAQSVLKPRGSDHCLSMDYLNYGENWAIFQSGILTCMIPATLYSSCIDCVGYAHPESFCPK